MMAGDRPTCKQCGEKLKPSYHNIDLSPTDEERVDRAIIETKKDYLSFGAEDCSEMDEDPKTWVNARYEFNMGNHHQDLFFNSKPDYARGPYQWGYNSNNNFCTLRCGIDYADDAVEAKARGKATVLRLVNQK